MNARRFLALTLLLAAACGGSDSAKKKNVILITLDTTRADFVSCYGVHPGVTPNLDAIAAQGTRFDMAISTAGVTPVSHASILTGLNNQEHRLRVLSADGGFRLPDNVPTLATVLAKEGYKTVAVHSALPVSEHFGFQRGFDVFEDMNGEIRETAAGKHQWDVQTFQRRSDETTDLVEKSLTEQPFFLWIHYWDAHDWAKVPPPEYMPPEEQVRDPVTKEMKRPGIPLYVAELHYQDAQIGRLFEWLKKQEWFEDTIVIVTADHGQGLMEHDWAAHRLLYQEQVHVPLLVRIPGEQQKPAVPDLVRTTDIFPTVLDYLGLDAPVHVSGRSLRALIEGRSEEKRIAFADQINGYDRNAGMTGSRPFDHFLYMAFDWPWKLIYRPLTPDKSLLYDVQADPDESRNLYAERADVRVRLLKELAASRPWVVGDFEKIEAGAGSANVAKGLEDLGYTGDQTVDPTWIWICPEHPDQRGEHPSSRCPQCKSALILAVDPSCIWVCPEHRDHEMSGPDQQCDVVVKAGTTPGDGANEPGVRCGKDPIVVKP